MVTELENMKKISIVIRTKNEERWIGHCLSMVYDQNYENFEVILVDNESTDHTVEIAKRYPVDKFINIEKFLPGKALNQGIRASSGDFIVCLSAHCVPKNRSWLSTLISNFENNEKLAGVYGRQLPTSFTDDLDKRDLLIVFGQDRRVQVKDYFFHNANSMLRRSVWDKFPFDEGVTNIEDRVWGKQLINNGYQIVYDPEAAVYHHHGLHHGNAQKRAKGVVSIIEKTDHEVLNEIPETWTPERANVAAVIPLRDELRSQSEPFDLLARAALALKKSAYVNNIYLVARRKSLADTLGLEFIDRKSIKNVDTLGTDELMKECLGLIEARRDFPNSILYVNPDYLDRPDGLFDDLIREAQYRGYDTVFPGYIDYGHYWKLNENGEYIQSDSSMKARPERDPVFRALYGSGCVTSSVLIRVGKCVGGKVGILPLSETRFTLRCREVDEAKEIESD